MWGTYGSTYSSSTWYEYLVRDAESYKRSNEFADK